ncbi:MAG: V-type proton ATPase subunit E [Chlamydiae bacterium]|nr:V-type proton ATPase subunit E [Chlamydiota bacterium]
MQQAVESGKDKVKKICEILRKETLEPAIGEAKGILSDAKKNADQIVQEAKNKAAKLIGDAEREIEKQQTIFKASLNQGARQSIEWLKQEIEGRLLNQNLSEMIAKSTCSPQVLADMVTAVVKAVEDEGLETDLSAIIPSAVEAHAVNELLGKEVLEKLKEKSVLIGPKKGGIEVKLHKDNITIDLSESALLELMTRYVRKDFHQFFFTSK